MALPYYLRVEIDAMLQEFGASDFSLYNDQEPKPIEGDINTLYIKDDLSELSLWKDGNYILRDLSNNVKQGGYTGTAQELKDDIDGKEDAFSKNTAFNKNFGINAGEVAQGNDSRILNGQTAYEKRITGLSITGSSTKTVTITLADGTTVTGSFVDDGGSGSGTSDGNDYVSGGSFNSATGTATLTRTDGGTVQFQGFVTDAEKATWNGKADSTDLDDALLRISDNEDDIADQELRITELENNPVSSVQSDWDETDTESDAFIKNKPQFSNISKDEYGIHPAFSNQHDLNVFLLENLQQVYEDIFPDSGRLFRYDFGQSEAQLSDLDGNYPAVLSVGGAKENVSTLVKKGWELSGENTHIASLDAPYGNSNLPISAIFLFNKTETGTMIIAESKNEQDGHYNGFSLRINENGIVVETGDGEGIDSDNRRSYEILPHYNDYVDIGNHLVAINIISATEISVSIDGRPFEDLIYENGTANTIELQGLISMGRRVWGGEENRYSTPGIWDEAAGYARLLSNQEVSDIWTNLGNINSPDPDPEEYSVEIIEPSPNSEFEAGTFISFMADTNGEAGTVEYYVDDEKVDESIDFPNYLVSWGITEGTHLIHAEFIKDGDTVASDAITVTGTPVEEDEVDLETPPEIEVSNPSIVGFNIKIS